jgi:hypothetical protein
MPNSKIFEAVSLSSLPFQVKMLSMEEVAAVYFGHITRIMDYLKNDKQATLEIPELDRIYKIIRKTSDEFHVKEWGGVGGPVLHVYSANAFLNWLFLQAPFIALVGEEMGEF